MYVQQPIQGSCQHTDRLGCEGVGRVVGGPADGVKRGKQVTYVKDERDREALLIRPATENRIVKFTKSGKELAGTELESYLEKLEALQWSKSGSAQTMVPSKAERRAEAKAKGYEGEMCGECGNFTLVRNGTCMKCDTCGSTTGCS